MRATLEASLTSNPFPVLSVKAAIAALEPVQAKRPPRIFHQFWDSDPPRQIQKLLKRNSKICAAHGIEHRVWTDAEARNLLQEYEPCVAEAYDIAPHAAMKSDVFRLAALHKFGGVYLDADMVLRAERGPDLWASFTGVLAFKWNLEAEKRFNSPNWCIGFRPGHPLADACLAFTASSMVQDCMADPDLALRQALKFGPGAFTQVLGGWVKTHGADGITLLDVQDAYRMVQNGPQFLKQPLSYKQTATHWLVAGRNTG